MEYLCKLAAHGIALGKGLEWKLTGTDPLGYVERMLCGDPVKHERERHAYLWGGKVGDCGRKRRYHWKQSWKRRHID